MKISFSFSLEAIDRFCLSPILDNTPMNLSFEISEFEPTNLSIKRPRKLFLKRVMVENIYDLN